MGERTYTRPLSPKANGPAAAPLRPARPASFEAPLAPAFDPAEADARLQRAESFGHHFDRISLSAPPGAEPQAPIQLKKGPRGFQGDRRVRDDAQRFRQEARQREFQARLRAQREMRGLPRPRRRRNNPPPQQQQQPQQQPQQQLAQPIAIVPPQLLDPQPPQIQPREPEPQQQQLQVEPLPVHLPLLPPQQQQEQQQPPPPLQQQLPPPLPPQQLQQQPPPPPPPQQLQQQQPPPPPPQQQLQQQPRGASLGSSLDEMLGRWAPSPAVTDPNPLQMPSLATGSGTPLPSVQGATQTAFTGTSVAGSGMQFLGSAYTLGKSIHTLAGDRATPRERKAAKVDLGESVLNTAGSGAGVAQGGLSLAGSAASTAAGVLGGVSGGAGAAVGTWWLAKHGRRAVSSFRRWWNLSKVGHPDQRGERQGLLGSVNAPQDLSQEGTDFLSYAKRKNRNQTIRAGLGALSGGLGAAAGAAGIAALLGATAATPVGWGLAAGAAAVGLGLGAWKLGQWARRKYQTARLGGQGRLKSVLSIFTRGKTRLQNEALEHQMNQQVPQDVAQARNPFGQAERHASWLVDNTHSNEGQALLRALNLHNHNDFLQGDRNARIKLIQHRLRSSG
jgi:hypothetical protein